MIYLCTLFIINCGVNNTIMYDIRMYIVYDQLWCEHYDNV